MADRSVKVILSAVDRLSAPLNKITNSLKPMEQGVKRVNDNLKGVGSETSRAAGGLNVASVSAGKFSRALGRTSAEATKAISKMGAFVAANDNLRWSLTRSAGAASAALGAMGAYSAEVNKADRAVRRFSMDRMVAGLRSMQSAARSAGRHLGDLLRSASLLGAVGAAGAAGAVVMLGKQVINTSATFERMGITLETIMGDKGKAQEALKWVSDFAQKTPFELAETSEAFVKLKSYGIDPMKGALTAAGNAAAIMGKPLNQAVEAMADAMTGENERLKEFGITAHIEGNKIQYNWMENGKAMTAFAQKNSRDQMLAVIQGIWNRQYQGGMDKLSMTWTGMVSNISDAWTRITQQIGEAGLFDFMKEQLKELLDYVTELQQNGKLQEWATRISRAATEMLKTFKEFVKGIDWNGVYMKLDKIGRVVGKVADFVGGPLNLALLTLGAMTFGPVISSMTMLGVTVVPLLWRAVAALIPAVTGLNLAMLANPVVLVTAAFIALVAAAVYVGRNWDYFKAKFVGIWKACGDAVARAWGRIKDSYSRFGQDIMSFFGGLWSRFTEFWSSTWDGIKQKTQDSYESIMDWLANFDMLAVGKDLIQRMWDGMKLAWDDMKKWFMKKVKDLFNFFGSEMPGGEGGSGGGFWGRVKAGFGGGSGGGGGGGGGGGSQGGGSNPGGAQPSGERGRGSANYMHGQHGGVGENQKTITTKSGRKVTVHKDAAPSFQGFLDELEGMGYKINSLGGLAIRGKRGGKGWSQHAYGNAIDINPAQNPMYKPKPGEPLRTDLPPNISDIAAKYGLSWGGDWKSVKDTMHFEWTGKTPEEKEKAAELKKKADAAGGHEGHNHGPNGEELPPSRTQGQVQTPDGARTDLRGKGGTPGLNNNNYGNLKFNPGTAFQRYPGVVGESKNKDEGQGQIVFKSLEDGITGAVRMAQRLQSEGKDTIRKMISGQGGWTPGKGFASKNIAAFGGFSEDEKIDLSNPETMKRFIKAMGKQEHGKEGAALDKKVDAVVDAIMSPTKSTAGAASPSKAKSPEAAKAEVERKAESSGLLGDAKNRAGPNGAGLAAAKAAGEAKGLTSGATHYNPQITVTGVADKDIPKKIESVTARHAADMKQRQREALHD